MRIGTVTSAAVAAAVWTQTTRSLTNMGPAFVDAGVATTNIATGTAVDYRPFAGIMNWASIGWHTASGTGSLRVDYWDGSIAKLISTLGAATDFVVFHVQSVKAGMKATNLDVTNVATYLATAIQVTL